MLMLIRAAGGATDANVDQSKALSTGSASHAELAALHALKMAFSSVIAVTYRKDTKFALCHVLIMALHGSVIDIPVEPLDITLPP